MTKSSAKTITFSETDKTVKICHKYAITKQSRHHSWLNINYILKTEENGIDKVTKMRCFEEIITTAIPLQTGITTLFTKSI